MSRQSSGGRDVAGEHEDVKFNLSHSSQSQDLIFELSMLRPVLKTLLADLLTKMSTRISNSPRHLMEDKYRASLRELSCRARRRGLRGRRKWRWDLARRRRSLSVTFVICNIKIAATSTPITRGYTSEVKSNQNMERMKEIVASAQEHVLTLQT